MPIVAHGFKFDVWKSGMSLVEVKLIARENGIHLRKAERKIKWTHLFLSYQDTILDKSARVKLVFTPGGERLYSVRIKWALSKKTEGEEREILSKVYSILCDKYGEPKMSKKGSEVSYIWIVFDSSFWHKLWSTIVGGERHSETIALTEGLTEINLSYTDEGLYTTGLKETREIRRKEKKRF